MDNKKICAHKCCICGYYKSLMSYPVSISFHSIPTKTNALADAWQKATGINKTLFLLGAKVCSRHFFETDFSPTAKSARRLHNFAVPSNHLEYNRDNSNNDDIQLFNETTEEQQQEVQYVKLMTNEETHVENVLSNTSTNSDTEMPLIFTIDQVDNSGKPKLYHESYLDFLQSNKDSYPESNQKVETKISGQRVINITQSESSAIEFHNQPSTSKQLFTIQTTIPIQTDSIMHYYDIDPMSCDNVNPGAIKRQRLN